MRRNILVIGNSDGIGAAVTRALVARGDSVVGISRSPSPLGPDGPRHVVADAASPDLADVVSRLDTEAGGFDACIYCAGIGSRLQIPDLSNEDRVFEVNLLGMVRALEALVPRWLDRKGGHFLGLSSLSDDIYIPGAPSYCASKAGMSHYLVSLGLKLRSRNVCITNIRFGFVDTKLAQSPWRPMMMSRERAAAHVLACLDRRPLQLSVPKTIGVLAHLTRWTQSLKVWMT